MGREGSRKILNSDIDRVLPNNDSTMIYRWTKGDFNKLISSLNSLFWREVFSSFIYGFKAYIKEYPASALMVNFWENPLFKRNNANLVPPNLYMKYNYCFPLQFIKGKHGQDIIFYTFNE